MKTAKLLLSIFAIFALMIVAGCEEEAPAQTGDETVTPPASEEVTTTEPAATEEVSEEESARDDSPDDVEEELNNVNVPEEHELGLGDVPVTVENPRLDLADDIANETETDESERPPRQ